MQAEQLKFDYLMQKRFGIKSINLMIQPILTVLISALYLGCCHRSFNPMLRRMVNFYEGFHKRKNI
jgi:hypothetical protein